MEPYIEHENDILIPIYEIGHGKSAVLYFCAEFKNYISNLKLKKLVLTSKVIKCFNDNSMSEYEKEIKIPSMLSLNGNMFDNVNYPVSYIQNQKIIIYNSCFGSLFDLCNLYNYTFNENIKQSIIKQMHDCVKNIHSCEYLHCDIKLENFLVCGTNLKQHEILEKIKQKLNLFYDIKIYKNIKNKDIISLSERVFSYIQNFFAEVIEEEDDDDDESVNTLSSTSSLNSNRGDFYVAYDKFHLNDIFDKIDNEMSVIDEKNNSNEQNYFNKQLENVKIIISDFGIISHRKIDRTCQYVNFRHYNNILGNITFYENDLWALELSIYEFLNDDLKFNIKNHPYYGQCENNLLVLYYLKTPASCEGIFKDIYFNKYCLKYV